MTSEYEAARAEKQCEHRGEQIATVICTRCGNRGKKKPVYACAVHGQCTHGLERRGQESQTPPIKICVGCENGPWSIPTDV
jgi:hypothetical protein